MHLPVSQTGSLSVPKLTWHPAQEQWMTWFRVKIKSLFLNQDHSFVPLSQVEPNKIMPPFLHMQVFNLHPTPECPGRRPCSRLVAVARIMSPLFPSSCSSAHAIALHIFAPSTRRMNALAGGSLSVNLSYSCSSAQVTLYICTQHKKNEYSGRRQPECELTCQNHALPASCSSAQTRTLYICTQHKKNECSHTKTNHHLGESMSSFLVYALHII